MSKIPIPRDCVGNPLSKDNFVVVQMTRPLLMRIVAIEAGGIHIANGMTPTTMRLVADLTITTVPGIPFTSVIRAVEPGQQAIIEGALGLPPQS